MEKIPDFSILINTRNRCGGPNAYPFSLTADSIKKQTINVPVLIMDDFSEPKQSLRLEKICKDNEFKYVRTDKHEGCNILRSKALDIIETPWHLILDDDYILIKNNVLESMQTTLSRTTDLDKKTAAIVFPSFDRTPFPIREVPKKDMGRVDFNKGITYWNLNTWPNDGTAKNPIPINALGAYGLYNTEALKMVGGLKKGGAGDYSMESDLGWRLSKKGFSLYYSPKLEQGCLHLKWGIKMDTSIQNIIDGMDSGLKEKILEKEKVESLDDLFNFPTKGINFKDMVALANYPTSGGCRIDEKTWIYEKVSNELSQIIKYYPADKKLIGSYNYIQRAFDHAKTDRISHRVGSFSEPCNRGNLNAEARKQAVFKGAAKGLVNGLIKR